MKKYNLISLLLHCLILLSVNSKNGFPNHGNGDIPSRFKGTPNAEINVKPDPITIDVVNTPDDDKPQILKKKHVVKKKIVKKCNGPWYGGIGIKTKREGVLEVVINIYPGYPASKSKLKVGDVIQDTDDKEIVGEPGTKVTLYIFRDNQVMLVIELVREKICYSKIR